MSSLYSSVALSDGYPRKELGFCPAGGPSGWLNHFDRKSRHKRYENLLRYRDWQQRNGLYQHSAAPDMGYYWYYPGHYPGHDMAHYPAYKPAYYPGNQFINHPASYPLQRQPQAAYPGHYPAY